MRKFEDLKMKKQRYQVKHLGFFALLRMTCVCKDKEEVEIGLRLSRKPISTSPHNLLIVIPKRSEESRLGNLSFRTK